MGEDPRYERDLKDAVAALEDARVRRDELIRQATDRGYTYREIAELVGISFQRVAQIMARHAV